jgi:hypothetical protein
MGPDGEYSRHAFLAGWDAQAERIERLEGALKRVVRRTRVIAADVCEAYRKAREQKT